MASSIKFDETEILNTTYIPRFVKHESAPERTLSLLGLAREDGSILVAEKYGTKRIILRGYLTATTQALLETAIDSFKELFSRKEKNLDISWEAGTRRYVATCLRHEFDRDHFHLLFVPWTAEFIVVKGIGEATSEIHSKDGVSFAVTGDNNDYDGSVTLAGSAKPRIRFKVRVGEDLADAQGFALINEDNGERIVMTRPGGFKDTIFFEVDCRLKKAMYNDVERDFYGVFPSFKVGANNYKVIIAEIPDQEFGVGEHWSGGIGVYELNYVAQSFTVPHTDETYREVRLNVKRVLNAGWLNVRIETDDGGKPSGTLVHANAVCAIAQGDIGTDYAWIRGSLDGDFELEANTRYWLVLKATGGDESNYYLWAYSSGVYATYKRGNAATSPDSGANWTDQPTHDHWFKICYGGKLTTSKTFYHDIYYYKRFL